MSDQFPPEFNPVFDALHISPSHFIAKGGEGFVFDFGDDKVVKIYPNTSRDYLEKLQGLQQRLAQSDLPYAMPLIESISEVEGVFYTIEKKLTGQNLGKLFHKLSELQQKKAIQNFLTALKPLHQVMVEDLPFGQILDLPDSIQTTSWKEFLLKKLRQKIATSKERISTDVTQFEQKVRTLESMIEGMLKLEPRKTFVHGDYYLTNVLVDESLEITSILDVSIHSCVGDHRLDLANINFMPLCSDITSEHVDFARGVLIEEYGDQVAPYLDLYGFYYAFYFSNLYKTDEASYSWCLSILNDQKRWEKYAVSVA